MSIFKKELIKMIDDKVIKYEKEYEKYDGIISYMDGRLSESELACSNKSKMKHIQCKINELIEQDLSDEEFLAKILSDSAFTKFSSVMGCLLNESKKEKEIQKDKIIEQTIKEILLIYKSI